MAGLYTCIQPDVLERLPVKVDHSHLQASHMIPPDENPTLILLWDETICLKRTPSDRLVTGPFSQDESFFLLQSEGYECISRERSH